MNTEEQYQQRIEDLEAEIISLQMTTIEQERQIQILDQVAQQQQTQIEQLRKDFEKLGQKLEAENSDGNVFNLEEEKPPHY